MDREALTKARAEVLEKFINIETFVNGIISQHYFKKVVLPFYLEVLYDENFTFALRRNILVKIVPNFDNSLLQDLNRLNRIRNYFAHCGPEIFEGSGVPEGDDQGTIPDPRRLGAALDFDGLYEEFVAAEENVVKYLFEIFQNLGGIAVKGK